VFPGASGGPGGEGEDTVLLFLVALCFLPLVSWNLEPPEMKAAAWHIKVPVPRSRIHLECLGQRAVRHGRRSGSRPEFPSGFEN
jgi:hypothetical protein